MKNSLSEIYNQIILNEAEKSNLQNPGSDEVSNIKIKQDLFGSKPKPVEGPEKAKLQKGPSYKETTGEKVSSGAVSAKSSMPKAAAGSSPKVDEAEEMEDTDVMPETEEDEQEDSKLKKKQQQTEESFTMSAFETLFKKTITEEIGEDKEPSGGDIGETGLEGEGPDEALGLEDEEEGLEEEEGDLISDLKEIQDKIASILAKLEDTMSDEEDLEGDEYNEEDFDDEFSPEASEEGDEAMKESIDGPKPLGDKKKVLQHKKNKVGKLSAKGGKAHTGNLKSQPSPSALGDKKKQLQSKSNQVKSSLKKGDFIK